MNLTLDRPLKQTISGLVWLFIGLVAVLLANGIKKPGFSNNQDPGPQFFPMLLGGLMVAGGIALASIGLFKMWRQRPQAPVAPIKQTSHRSNALVWFILGFGAYVFLIPWLGFTVSSLFFGMAMVWLQGSRWYVSIAMILTLLIGINLLFGMLFHVQLPQGVLGLPF